MQRPLAQKFIRLFGFLLALSVFAFNFTSEMRAVRSLGPAIFIESGDSPSSGASAPYLSSVGAVTVSDSGDETLGERRMRILLFGFAEIASIPVNVSERGMLIPGGNAVGITIHTSGVLVVGFGDFTNDAGKKCCPAKHSQIRVGDIIVTVNGQSVNTAEEMQLALNADPQRSLLMIARNGKRFTVNVTPAASQDGSVKLGAWVRDSTIGVGTLSFVVQDSSQTASLGHAVQDADTGCLLPVRSGSLSAASILGVTRGRSGSPGELRGTFSAGSPRIGSITSNSELGVFGLLENPQSLYENGTEPQALPVAFPTEVHEGEATILANVDGEGVKSYACRIIRTMKQDRPDQKGLVIEITDEALLEKTGGIVQGMSGSPIIQDGRLAAVVTHVFVNDPLRGYGIYAYWMYTACKNAAG